MGDPRGALELRRANLDRSASMTGGRISLDGFIDLSGVGEATIEVPFPMQFVERPVITSGGGELAEGETLEAGRFPRWNVGVKDWRFTERSEGAARIYTGALLVVVCEGRDDPDRPQQSTAHYKVEGTAIVNPVGSSLSDPI